MAPAIAVRLKRQVHQSVPLMREHIGGLILVTHSERSAIFYRGRKYRCQVAGVELPCRAAGRVACAAMTAFVAGVEFRYEELK